MRARAVVTLARPAGLALLTMAACAAPTRITERELAAAGIHRLRLATGDAHGLSGLAMAADGAIWTVAERSRAGFRIELDRGVDPPRVRAIDRWPVTGLPRWAELESLAITADGSFVIGTEGTPAGVVAALRLDAVDGRLVVRGEPLEWPDDQLGVDAGGNHGLEGACSVTDGPTLLAVEASGPGPGPRWTPLLVVTPATGAQPPTTALRRLRLTTATGKLSGLDCWREGDRIRVVAIERHFAVTRILGFDLTTSGELVPTVIRDLAPVLRGRLNLEGIVRLPDGHLVVVIDNQYGRITGPDELLWLPPIADW